MQRPQGEEEEIASFRNLWLRKRATEENVQVAWSALPRRRCETRVIFIWSLTEGLDTGAGGQEVEELDNPRDCGLLSSVIGMKEENCRKILVYSIGS